MTLAVGHLVQKGHRRIGLAVGPDRFVPSQRKAEGFVTALLSKLDVSLEEAFDWVEHSLFSVEGGHVTATSLLARGATGIVGGSDLMALGAIRAARQQSPGGVPLSVSVAGHNDSPLVAFTDPPLTTVRQPVQAMGSAAVRALLDAIAGRPVPSTDFIFRPELVVRGSTAAAPTPVSAGVPACR